tara:strand:+ start:48780 stop:49187 length:408 start_codon:yes stop_codon:yes gene_type:complete
MKYIKRLNIKKIFESYSNIGEFHWGNKEEAKEIMIRILNSMDLQNEVFEDKYTITLQFELNNHTFSCSFKEDGTFQREENIIDINASKNVFVELIREYKNEEEEIISSDIKNGEEFFHQISILNGDMERWVKNLN